MRGLVKNPNSKYSLKPLDCLHRYRAIFQLQKETKEDWKSSSKKMRNYLHANQAQLLNIDDSEQFIHAAFPASESSRVRRQASRPQFGMKMTRALIPCNGMQRDRLERCVARQQMPQIAFEDFFRTWDTQNTASYLYIVRDDLAIYYIGQTLNTEDRLSQHLGEDDPFGNLYRLNMRAALSWIVEVPTLDDCEQLVVEALLLPEDDVEKTMAEIKAKYQNPKELAWAINTAEQALIGFYRPCCNMVWNPFPTPLPSQLYLGRTKKLIE